MNPLHPLFAFCVFFIAYVTGHILKSKYKIVYTTARYETIDGLRGFLAIAVFIHHASIWHRFIQVGDWEAPVSNFYNQLGQTSVSLFFMITSFLFITKLLKTNESFNWSRFFISRVFRLAPLYYVSLLIIVFFVMVISHWQLNVELNTFVSQLLNWCIFTIIKMPNINDLPICNLMNAAVAWTLPYEWLFYFSLPLISIFILKNKPSVVYIIISSIFVVGYFSIHGFVFYHILSFMGGALAPFLIKYTPLKNRADNLFFSALILICLSCILFFNSSNDILCKFLIIIIFTLIALGNTMGGILKNSTLKFLGEVSYSTYLLHGIVVFTVFNFVFGMEEVKSFSPLTYCILIFSMTPILVIISFIGFRYVEKPGIDMGKKIISRLIP